jgi:hypothetical protein
MVLMADAPRLRSLGRLISMSLAEELLFEDCIDKNKGEEEGEKSRIA